MSYYLWKADLARTPKLEISQAEHDAIIVAWEALFAVVNIEEEWDSLIQNYIELEMELLESAMHTMVLDDESYEEMQQQRSAFSRRLSNLLQTCRSYIDHAPHHLGKIQEHSFKSDFHELRQKAHAAHFSYRFMDAMRNYAQHRGVPLHGATYHATWLEDETGRIKGRMRHVVTALIDLERIRNDKKFNAKVRAEIEGTDQLDIATLTREYVEALATIQTDLRKRMAEAVTGWKATVRDAISRFEALNDGNSIGLTVSKFANGDREIKTQRHIFDDMLLRLEHLMRKNGSLVNLRQRYVSNEIIPPKNR